MNQAQRTIRVLLIDGGGDFAFHPTEWLGDCVDVVSVNSIADMHPLLSQTHFDYVLADPAQINTLQDHDVPADHTEYTDQIEQGVGIVDGEGALVWANPRLLSFSEEVRDFVRRECAGVFAWAQKGVGKDDVDHLAGRVATLATSDNRYCELTATPIIDIDHQVTQVVAVVRDVTRVRARRLQLEAVDHAGRDLVRLDADQISQLDMQERVALLEQKIIRYLRELMHFDHFSIHILDKKSNKLELLVCSGLSPAVESIDLYAADVGNGISGYVAYSGRSYICGNVLKDSRYFKGLDGARSSLTVPLQLNNEVIGVLNVESNQVNAFDTGSRELAERFGRDIAMVLHVLDLLVTERYTTTGRLGNDVMAEITAPLNDLLTDAETLKEDYIGHDDLRHRLDKIVTNALSLRDAIRTVTSPKRGIIGRHATGVKRSDPILTGKSILIADDETMIRETVRDVLISYGCSVEVAEDGDQAVKLIADRSFDLVLSDIKMPGLTGYEVFAAAKDASAETPVILMTGFGYDPNHSIVRARREGLAAVLFKPFKVDQLLGEIRTALQHASVD